MVGVANLIPKFVAWIISFFVLGIFGQRAHRAPRVGPRRQRGEARASSGPSAVQVRTRRVSTVRSLTARADGAYYCLRPTAGVRPSR
jgi:hypothetical protein